MDMPIADVRRILSGIGDADRRQIFRDHRARLEARLDEVHRLLEAVDLMSKEDTMTAETQTDMLTWLHLMPRLPVSDMSRWARARRHRGRSGVARAAAVAELDE